MLDPTAAAAVTLRELTGFMDRAETLGEADWSRPVRCQGWVVADLVHHLAWAVGAQSLALERLRSGDTDQVPLDIPAPGLGSPAEDRAVLRRHIDRMTAALSALVPEDMEALCGMPFAVLPAPVALNLVAAEAGIHRNDLLWALGDEEALGSDVVAALTVIMSNALPALAGAAGEPPERNLGYRLAGRTVAYDLRFRDGGWVAGNGSAPDCEVSGDDSAITLFVMGRIGATHPSLTVTREPALAARFKRFFPGP